MKMCRNAARAATAALLILTVCAIAPGTIAAVPAKTPATTAKPADSAPRKATLEQRQAADRLDPLSRAAFWGREFDVDANDAEAGVGLARALRELGRFPEAADAAERVSIAHPASLDALLEVARAQIGAGRGFYAIAPLKTAQALKPADWRIASLMGIALEQAERLDEARAAWRHALELSPENPAVLTNLALSYAARGDAATAEPLLRRAAKNPASTIRERQNLAMFLGLRGQVGEAERLMRQDLPPEQVNANLAYFRAASGEAAAPASAGDAQTQGARSWGTVKASEQGGRF